ncbi:MAG TPA: hypothetical protein VKV26_21820 [Dehalococcoidia bacterium]|nr:hypothetical protein [Dehalococcoidia bacterium]
MDTVPKDQQALQETARLSQADRDWLRAFVASDRAPGPAPDPQRLPVGWICDRRLEAHRDPPSSAVFRGSRNIPQDAWRQRDPAKLQRLLCPTCIAAEKRRIAQERAAPAATSTPKNRGGRQSRYTDLDQRTYVKRAGKLKPGRTWAQVAAMLGLPTSTLHRWMRRWARTIT